MRTVYLSLLVRWFKQVLKGRIRRFARAASLAVTSAVLFIGNGAYADTRDFDPLVSGGTTLGGPGTWDNLTTSNWWNGAQVQWNNANNDTARFGGTTGTGLVNLAAGGITAGGLTFNTNGYSLSGGVLTLAGATPTITVTTIGQSATINSNVDGTTGLTKVGIGTLILAGANPYTGITTINNGTLRITNAAGLGSAAAGTVVNAGGVLDIANVSTAEALTLNGRGQPVPVTTGTPGPMYSGALMASTGITGANTAATITLGSNVSIGAVAGAALTLSGSITDGGSGFSLTKVQGNGSTGANPGAIGAGGTLVLTGASTYTGATTIEAGELRLANTTGQAISSTVVNIGDASNNQVTLTLGASNQMPSNVIINFNNGNQNAKFQLNGFNQTVAGFNDTGVLAIIQNFETAGAGVSTLTINNPADSSFNCLIRDSSPAGGLAVTKTGVGTFTFGGDAASVNGFAVYTGATNVTGGKLVLKDQTAFNSPISISGTGSLEINNNFGRNLTYSKAIVDNGLGFTKTGMGAAVLQTVASTVTGTVNVNGGSLVLASIAGVNPMANAPINVAAGAQLDLYGFNGATTYNNAVTLNGLHSNGALAGAVIGGTPVNTLSGTLTLNATSNLSTGWADKSLIVTGQITGPGGLQFDKMLYTQQPPIFQINNAANDYAGGTKINAGTVYFTNGLPATGNLNFGGWFTQSSLNTLTGPNIVLGTNGLAGFTRAIGTGAGQVSFTGEGGGFSAVGSAQTVNFGGASGSVDWGGPGFSAGASLWFNDSNTLSGASAFNADNTVTVTNDLVLSSGGMRRIYVADNNGSATDQVIFSGAISGPGGLIKDGANSAAGANLQGRLTLSGAAANTYTGVTDVIAGVLVLNKTAGVNAVGGDLQIGGAQNNGTRRIVVLAANDQIPDTANVGFIGSSANNGDLRMFGFNETVAAINDRSGGGVIEIADAGDVGTTAATVSTLTVNGPGDSFFNGFFRNNSTVTTGNLSLIKNGTGTLTISAGQQSGGGSQTYAGATTVNGGTFVLRNVTTLNSPITVNATATVGFESTLNVSANEGQVISGAGNLTKRGIGTAILSNAANSYSGTTTVEAGTLNITGAQTVANTGLYTVNPGGTLLIGNGSTAGALSNNNAITNNGTAAFSRNNAYIYSGIISGTGNVESRAGGTATILSGANTYSGTTTVLAGSALTLAGSGASAGGLTVNAGGTLTLDYTQAGSSATNLVASGTPVALNGGTLTVSGGAVANTQTLGPVTLNAGGSNLNLTSGAGGLTVNLGAITHATGGTANIALPALGGAVTSGPAISGIANGFTTTSGGTTWVAQSGGGNLTPLAAYGTDAYGAGVNTDVVAGGAGGSTNSLRFNAAAAPVTLTGTNTLASGGLLVTPAAGPSSITGGTLTGTAATGLNVIQNSGSGLSISSTVADSGGATGLTKTGTGTLTLTGSNSYGGPTVVSGGTLITSGTTGSGLASVLSGATFQIGDGTTNGIIPYFPAAAGTVIIANGTAQAVPLFNAAPNFNEVTNAVANSTSFQTGIFQKVGAGTLTINNPLVSSQFHPRAGTTEIVSGGNVFVSSFSSIGLANGDNATLTVKGAGRYTVSGDLNVSDQNTSRGTLNIQDAALVNAGTLYLGKTGTSVGVVNQTWGSLINTGGGDWRFGGNGTAGADTGAYGAYNLSAGTFQTSRNFQIGASGIGVWNQNGGTASITGGFNVIGRFAGTGLMNLTGGTLTNSTTNRMIVGENGTAVLNVGVAGATTIGSAGQVLITGVTGGLGIGSNNAGAGNGVVNLLAGGLIQAPQVADQNTNSADGSSILNFNGGTLRVTTGSTVGATFLTGTNLLTQANIFSGGANIDTNGIATTIGQAFLAPAGDGVTSIALGSGGSGYAGEPIVSITGGGGTGATARAIVSGGAITGFTITSPGTGYTSAPTISVLGGGPTAAGTAGAVTTAANPTTGGLSKLNTGVLTLTGTSTYGGSTTITGGSITESFSTVGGTNILPANGLVINGGGLTLTGFAAGANTQTFPGTTISGVGNIVSNIGAGGTMTTTLGAITRTAGGATDVSGTGTINTLTANTGTTILGGWATQGSGATWAVSAGTGAVAGDLTGLAAGGYVANTWAAGNNTNMTTAGAVASLTTNSVRWSTATPVLVTNSGTSVITTGGILITPTETTAATILTGGTINTSGTGVDLVVNHFGTGAATIVSAIGASTGGLVKAGPGVLVLSSPTTTNLYTGATMVGAGTLRIGVTEQIPNGSSVTIGAGATLDLNSFSETINGLSGYGTATTAIAGTPTLTIGSGGASSTFSGIFTQTTGTLALAKTGAGTLTLNNLGTNTYTGATTISAGAIAIASPLSLSNNTTINVNVAGGLKFDTTIPVISGLGGNSTFALQTQATSPIPNAPVQLTVGNNNAGATYSGALTGTGTLVKIGTGTQILSGANTNSGGIIGTAGHLLLTGNNSGAGPSTIASTGGTIVFGAPNTLYGASGRNVIVAPGGVVGVGGVTANPASVAFPSASSILSRIDSGSTGVLALTSDGSLQTPISENLDFSAAGPGGALNLSLGAVLTGNSGLGTSAVRYTGLITPVANTFLIGGGSGRLIMANPATLSGNNNVITYGGGNTGGGQLFLTSDYTYTGNSLLNAGSTIVTNLQNGGQASSLGASSSAASNLVLNAGTLQYVGSGATTDRLFTIGAGTLDASGSGPVNFANTGAMGFLNNTGRTLTLQGPNTGANTLAPAIGDAINVAGTNGALGSGATAIAKNGNGTWILSGNNTFSGGVTINNGVLQFNNAASIGANTVNGPASVLVNAGGAAAFGPGLTGSIQTSLNRISPLSTGTVALTANTSEAINLDGGSAGAALPQVSLGAYGNVTYTGTLTPFANQYRLGGGGGVLTIPSGGLAGPRVLTVGGGGPGSSLVNNPNLNGNVVLGGASDYTGGTILATGGVLSATSLTALGSGPLKFQGGWYRAVDGTDITLASDGVSARDVRIGFDSGTGATANIDVASGVNLTFSKTLGQLPTYGSNQGQAALTKFGAGTLILGAGLNLTTSGATASSNTGTLTIERGTLSILSNPTNYTGNIQVGSNNGGVGTLKLAADNLFRDVNVQFNQRSVIDLYTGSKLDLNGFSDTVRLVRGPGSIVNTGASTANLTIGINNEQEVLSGHLVGNFTLTVGGNNKNTLGASGNFAGLELLNNNNANFTGKLVANAGGIRPRNDGSLGSPTEPFMADKITLNNGAVLQSGPTSFTPMIIGANHGITIGATGGTIASPSNFPMIINSPITGPGQLTIGDETGFVFLANDNNNYAGGTAISSASPNNRGYLSIGAGGATGSLPSGDVFFNATSTAATQSARLFFFKSTDMTVPNTIYGTGQIFQIGSGTTTLTGNNNTNQQTVVSAGRLIADFSNPANAPISTGTVLNISAGAFEYKAPAGANTFRLGSLTSTVFSSTNGMNATTMVGGGIGDGTVQSTYGGSGVQQLVFNASARGTAGVTTNFVTSGGANGVTNSIMFVAGPTPKNAMGAAYYFNGSDFAALDPALFVRAVDYGNDLNTNALDSLASSGNFFSKLTTSITGQAAVTVTGLNLSGPGTNLSMAAAALTTTGANPGALLKSGGGTSIVGGTAGSSVAYGANELILRTATAADTLQIDVPLNGTSQLTKSGPGQLTLTAANTNTGNTLITQGTVLLTGNGTLGTAASNTGEIRMATVNGQTATLNIDSPTAGITMATTANAFRVGEAGNGIVNQSNGTVNVANFLTIGESLGATGTYNLSGPSTLNVKTNPSAAPPGGANANNLVVGRAGTGTLNISGSSVLNMLNGGQIMLGMGTNNSAQFQGMVPDAQTSSGVGTITQTGGNVTVAFNNGTYQSNVFGAVIIGVNGAGTYNLNGGTLTTPMIGRGNGTATFNLGGGTLKAATPVATLPTSMFHPALAINVTGTGAGKGVIDTNGNDVTMTSTITGTGGFAKAGAGTLTVIGTGSTYAGGTDINQGTVVSSNTSLGVGNVNVGAGNFLSLQGVQQGLLAKFYDILGTSVNPNVSTGSAAMLTEFSSLDNLNSFLNGKAPIAVESTAARDKVSVNYLEIGGANGNTALPPAVIQTTNGSNPFMAHLSGTFNAITAGDYTFQSRSDDNSVVWVDGQTVVDNNRDQGQTTRTGTVNLTAGAHDITIAYRQGTGGGGFSVGVTQPGLGQSFTIGSELNMSNSLLSYGSNDLTIGSLSGAAGATVQLGSGKLTTGGDNSSTVYNGAIIDGPNGVGGRLTKIGNGVQTLTGISTYTGETVVSGGNLRIEGNIATSSLVTVNSGGRLSGSGTVGPLFVNGGTVGPGSSPGILTTGSVTTSAGSTFEFELTGPTPGAAGYDQIRTNGTLGLNGTLVTALTYQPAVNDKLFIWLNDGTDPITGNFTGLPEGSTIPTPGGGTFTISYAGNGDTGAIGNDVSLTYVPEPGSAAMLAAGAAMLGLRRRRAA